jgi:LEA14-like dessication related protein
MRNKKYTIIPLLLLAILINSCIQIKPVYIKQIKSISVDKVSLSEARLKMEMMICNHNSFSITVKDADIEVYLNEALIGKLKPETTMVVIPARSEMDYCTFVEADISKHLFGSLIGIINNKAVPVTIKGEATLKKFIFEKHVEFNSSDTISLKSLKNLF